MKTPFDEIFFLTLTSDINRVENVKAQIKKLNIEDKSTIIYTCKNPYSQKLGEFIIDFQWCRDYPHVFSGVFNCGMEHYKIIRTSYERGLNQILICEDDCNFIDDLNLIEETFNNLPKDYCCVKFHTRGQEFKHHTYRCFGKQIYFRDNFKKKNVSLACYALDRNGMVEFMKAFERNFRPADCVFDDFIDKVYCIKKRIVNKPNMKSNIETK